MSNSPQYQALGTPQYREIDRLLETRLIRLEDKLDAMSKLLDEAVISRLRDHEKRIAALESWRAWLIGLAVGGSAVCSVLSSLALQALGTGGGHG